MLTKILLFGGFSLIGLGILFIWEYPDAKLRIIACDVGQGDAILIQRAFLQILVDGGPNKRVLNCLRKYMPFWDRKIEAIILTHSDSDHLTGVVEVLNRYQVTYILTNGYLTNSELAQTFFEAIETSTAVPVIVKQGSRLTFGSTTLDFIWPPVSGTALNNIAKLSKYNKIYQFSVPVKTEYDTNADSLVFRLDYFNYSGYFTGDIGTREELALVRSGLLKPAQFLKIAHHGSKYSTAPEFLELIRPEIAFVSSGKNNRFKHPHPEVLSRLNQMSVNLWRTDVHGDLILSTDGLSVIVLPK